MDDPLAFPSLEQWQQVEQLFDRARLLSPAERALFLDTACDGDPSLRAVLDRLLAALDRADPFLDGLDTERAAALLDDAPGDERVLIGPYRVEREVGRGGMGAVYLANRATGQFDQQVALKLLKRGMDSDAILRRFLHERQILARLHHPHIARLYDGGVADDGRPYFAMEYVDGVPITQYCDERRLDVDARLRLFQDVCRAVQYAHQNLVVHRDLKPSNMLVTEDGELKLLDFGIAKLLSEATHTPETLLTVPGLWMMTPEYAAPEQVRGETITTATDVYAMGVVLYELLTGHRPYYFERRTPEVVARVLADGVPERPSTAVSRTKEIRHTAGTTETITPEDVSRYRGMGVDRLRRRLSGDLDTIVLKSLHREPTRRYASAEALLEDVKRHLAGLPVQAHRDTFSYRASKFIRRHWMGVAAALAFVVLLAASAVTLAVQQARTARERDKAEEIKDFVLSLFVASNPLEEPKGDTITARALLERGVARIDEELQEQPEVRAEMLAVVGTIYKEVGRYDRAGPLLERALALRRDRVGENHPDVAQSLNDLASLKQRQGNYDEAERLYRDALTLRRKLWGNEHLDVASSMSNLGVLLRQQGNYDEAERLYRDALAVQRRLLGQEHPQVLTTLNNLAVVLHAKGDYDEAEQLHRDALAARRKVLGDEHPHTALSLNNLGWVLYDKGDYEAAESFYRQALVMKRKLLGDEHPEVALSLNNLGTAVRQKGDYDEAERLFLEALAMRRKLLGDAHPDVALTLNSLALLKRLQGQYDAAETYFRQSLDLHRRTLPEGHPRISFLLLDLGRLLLELDRPDEAARLLREAMDIQEQTLPEGHWRRAEAQSLLGACLSALGRYDEAEPLLLGGYEGLKATRKHDETRHARRYLADHYERQGKHLND